MALNLYTIVDDTKHNLNSDSKKASINVASYIFRSLIPEEERVWYSRGVSN